MSKKIAGPEIERLVQLLSRLPGLGPRSARKAALALLKRRDDLLAPLSEAMSTAVRTIVDCPVCGSLDTVSPCTVCRDERRDRSVIVVVEEMGDLWALERASVINANYHVLGGHLSPLDGIGPERDRGLAPCTRCARRRRTRLPRRRNVGRGHQIPQTRLRSLGATSTRAAGAGLSSHD